MINITFVLTVCKYTTMMTMYDVVHLMDPVKKMLERKKDYCGKTKHTMSNINKVWNISGYFWVTDYILR